MEKKESFVCLKCLHPTPTMFHKYSTDVIRLTECKECGSTVDKYVEYDTVLVIIDLILHYSEAYRHILYNMQITSHIRLAVIFLFCDAYDKWISGRSSLPENKQIYELEWIFYESLIQSAVEMGIYITMIILFELCMRRSADRLKFICQSTVIGYYGNVAVVLSIIFRLSNEFFYRAATQLFIFVSHVQVQRALLPEASIVANIVVVILALVTSRSAADLFRTCLSL